MKDYAVPEVGVTTGTVAVGLNPYGLTYTLGLQGLGTPRANPQGTGLDGFIAVAQEIGARVLEIHQPWLSDLDATGLATLRDRLAALGLTPIVSASLHWTPNEAALDQAVALGARTVRMGLSPILCGDRNAFGAAQFAQQVASIRADLGRLAPLAAERGLSIAIENHQDFGSAELMSFCE